MAVIARDVYIVEHRGVRELADALDKAADGADRLGDASRKAAREQDKGSDAADRGTGAMDRFRGSLVEVHAGLQLASAGLRTMQKLAAKPIGLAVNFEREFAQVRTLAPQLIGRDLERGLLDLAARVPQTAGDITKAAYQAISAGIDPSETVRFLEQASKAAVASNSTLTEAVDSGTSVVNAYRSAGLSAAEAYDILFGTIREAKTTLPELNAALSQAIPAAAQYGISLEEVGAAVAVFTKQGSSTAEAMTLVNAAIKVIAKSKGQYAAAFKDMGIEIGAARLQSEGLTPILDDIAKRSRGNAAALNELAGRFEGVRSLIGLVGDEGQSYRESLDAIAKSTGAVSEANEIMAGTTQGAINRFKSMSEGVLRDLGTASLPLVNGTLSVTVDTMGSMSGALTDVIREMERMEPLAQSNRDVWADLTKQMTAAAGGASLYAAAMAAVRSEVSKQNAESNKGVFEAFTNPFGAAGGGIAGSLAGAGRGVAGRISEMAANVRKEIEGFTPKTKGGRGGRKRGGGFDVFKRIGSDVAREAALVFAEQEAEFQLAFSSAESARAAAFANAERAAGLDPNNLDAQLEFLDMRRQMEVEAARLRGEDLLLVEREFAERAAQIQQDAAMRKAEIFSAQVSAISDVASGGLAVLNALGLQSQALQRAEAAVGAAKNLGLAQEAFAKAFVAKGSFNFWSSAQFLAGGLAHTAAAIKLARVAGGGVGGGGGAPSGASGGGGGLAPDARPNRFQDERQGSQGTWSPTFNLNFGGMPLATRTDIQDAVTEAIREGQKRLGAPVMEV